MGQAIQVIPGSQAESKTADPLMMIGKVKSISQRDNKQAGQNDDAVNDMVSFIQLLHQQMSQAGKVPDDPALTINEDENTENTALLLSQKGFAAKDLQLTSAAMREIEADAQSPKGSRLFSSDVLPEDFKGKSVSGNAEAGLKQATDEQIQTGSRLFSSDVLPEDFKGKSVSGSAEAGFKRKADVLSAHQYSGDNDRPLTDSQTFVMGRTGEKTSDDAAKNLFISDESLPAADKYSRNHLKEMPAMHPENVAGLQSDTKKVSKDNFNAQPDGEGADREKNFRLPGREKQTVVLNAEGETVRTEKMAFNEAFSADVAAGNPEMSLMKEKEEKRVGGGKPTETKITESENEDLSRLNISPASSEEDREYRKIINESRRAFRDAGEYQTRGDKKLFSEAVYPNADNKVQSDAMPLNLSDISLKSKTEQKIKNFSEDMKSAEISLNPAGRAGSLSENVQKVNDVAPDQLLSQVTGKIKENAAGEGGRVKVVLNPPSLGTLEMDVTVRNGKVEVILVADNKDVQQTLNHHLDKLKVALQSQDLTVEKCDVFMQDKHDEYQQNFNRQTFNHQSRSGQEHGRRQEDSAEQTNNEEVVAGRPLNITRLSTERISLFA